ncbi:MAG: alpha/beta fold hydrolase [Solirubrobacterales bacterium]
MQLLSATRPAPAAPPAMLDALLERYEPEAIDLPDGPARIRLTVEGEGEWDAVCAREGAWIEPARGEPDAKVAADAATWTAIARDVRGGMDAYRRGRLSVRRNLHLGVGFLAATSGSTELGRLRFVSVPTSAGCISTMTAGEGEPVVCIHGLGGTKASFLPTLAALAPHYRVIAIDLPGFGDSDKPLGARYDSAYFADATLALLDELGLDSARLIGNSMGGRVAIEVGLCEPERVDQLVLLSPAMAWLRDRNMKWLLSLPLPRLGLLQPTPRAIVEPIVRRLVPGGDRGWSAAGVDEFLRSYLTAAGRFAFYEAARNVYLDEPHGDNGFWHRLEALACDAMFVWGRQDQLVPIAFMRHVERALPAARHLELECGHVPQLEAPKQTHEAILEFFSQPG